MSVAVARTTRGRVLLLEPEDSLAELLEGLLTEWGFACERACTEAEALARLHAAPPEVLVVSEPAVDEGWVDRILGSGPLPARPILLASDERRTALDGPNLRVLLKPSELDLLLYEVNAAAELAASGRGRRIALLGGR